MNNWINFNKTITNNLSFSKIRKREKYNNENGKIFFESSSDNNLYIDGYIDLSTSIVFFRQNYREYETFDLNDTTTFLSLKKDVKIFAFDDVQAVNNFQFFSKDPRLNENLKVIENKNKYVKVERLELKSTDNTIDWFDTGNKRQLPASESQPCNCEISYRYVETDRQMCDGKNLHKTEKLQYRIACGYSWQDYQPEIIRLGNVISENAGECGGTN